MMQIAKKQERKLNIKALIMGIIAGVLLSSPSCYALGRGTLKSVKVIKIIDGDSLLVLDGKDQVQVRLWGIDTPEYAQPKSSAAKQFTKNLVMNQKIYIEIKDWDRYGRMVAMVETVDNKYLNAELLKVGLAWVHIYYCKEPICDSWYDLEEKARRKQIGIWEEQSPTPPWQWKRKHKSSYKR